MPQESYMTNDKERDFKQTQKDLTEQNPDGDSNSTVEQSESEEERRLRKRIEELRKRDPFIYR